MSYFGLGRGLCIFSGLRDARCSSSIWEAVGGLERVEPVNGADNWERHQSMSDKTLAFGCLWI